MPTRASKRRDFTQIAKDVVDAATGNAPPPKPDTRNQAAVALSKLGASKGGAARAKKLSKAKRSEIALKAARIRWKIYRQTESNRNLEKEKKARS